MATLGPGGEQQIFDFSTSNLILMVGGQILILVILLMIVLFGVPNITSPIKMAKKALASSNSKVNL
jgi:hypothetical protein